VSETHWIFLGGAILTYLTRAGGHLVLSRFDRLHPRVAAALDAVPAAVLTTLVAPSAAAAGPAELGALAVAGRTFMRFGLLISFLAGAVALAALRSIVG
jgi:uncharacterized membrane protein